MRETDLYGQILGLKGSWFGENVDLLPRGGSLAKS